MHCTHPYAFSFGVSDRRATGMPNPAAREVLLTKNGHGRYALLDMADYDRLVAEQALFSELQRGIGL